MNKSKLERRFQAPNNWRQSDFLNPETNHKIRYGHAYTPLKSKGVVVILPGLSEFCEKYFETCHFFLEQQYDVFVIDWSYQGYSSRFENNPHKRHSDGYDSDINDLKYLIDNHIEQNKPLFMLGHSMGGHIGLRFLSEQDKYFKAASFSAPMIGIRDLRYINGFIRFLSPLFNLFKDFYIPGGKNWHKSARKSDGTDIFSSDPIRDTLHNYWCLKDPRLQVGNPTIQWVLESLFSIEKIEKNFEKINVPFLLGIAELEEIVCNEAIEKIAKKNTNSKIVYLKNSKHEILMETDDIRDIFLKETIDLFNQSA